MGTSQVKNLKPLICTRNPTHKATFWQYIVWWQFIYLPPWNKYQSCRSKQSFIKLLLFILFTNLLAKVFDLRIFFSLFWPPHLPCPLCPIFEGHFEPLLPRPSFLVRWSYFLANDVQFFGSFGPNQLPTLELDVVNNGCSRIAKGSVKLTSILDGWKFSPDEILPKRIFVHLFIYPVFLAVDVCANSASSCHDSPEFQSKISCKAIETGIVYIHNG